MEEIAWDLDLLEAIQDHLDQISNYLQEHVDILSKIQEEAAGEWQSEAGRIYSDRLEADIKELADLQQAYIDLKDMISEVLKKYASGETEVHRALLNSIANLSV